MLLGIWGPFAVGKTTHINAYMARCNGNDKFRNVRFVYADNALVFHMDRYLQFRDVPTDEAIWKGKQIDKVPWINDMVADDRTFWVVESARYFTGMYECLVKAHNMSDGGLRFIVPITDGSTMIKFMQARCKDFGKEFNAEYWQSQRAIYEADGRYTNAVQRWFIPNGIPVMIIPIDESRDGFYRMNGCLDTWLGLQPDQWYGIAQSLKVYAQVPEAIEIERKRQGRH